MLSSCFRSACVRRDEYRIATPERKPELTETVINRDGKPPNSATLLCPGPPTTLSPRNDVAWSTGPRDVTSHYCCCRRRCQLLRTFVASRSMTQTPPKELSAIDSKWTEYAASNRPYWTSAVCFSSRVRMPGYFEHEIVIAIPSTSLSATLQYCVKTVNPLTPTVVIWVQL